MLNQRAKDIASLLNVNGRRVVDFVGEKELMNRHRCVNLRMRCSQGAERGLNSIEVGQHAFRGDVQVMEMGGL